jgi:very-short-patch-repair endonuclease
VLSHVSAAVELGLPVLVAPSQVHVTVPSGDAVRPPPGVVLHRSDLPPPDRRLVATRPLRTVVDCALSLPFAEALAVADSALREGLIGMDDLRWAGAERRGPGRKRLLRVTEAANDLAANPFESALRATVLEAGATRFRPQCAVRLTNGRIVHVDLGDPDLEVALEADSYAHHGSRHALREDCRRYDELIRAGWLVLRFAWEHVILDARWVADTVLDTCALRSPDRCAPPLRRRNGPLRAGR